MFLYASPPSKNSCLANLTSPLTPSLLTQEACNQQRIEHDAKKGKKASRAGLEPAAFGLTMDTVSRSPTRYHCATETVKRK
jgi:hypothetical protein